MKNNQPNIHAMYGQTKIECGLAKSKLTFLNRCKSYIKRFILVLFIVLGFFKVSDAQIWKPLGPWGGEVYGIAGDSSILFAFVINQNKDVRVFKSTNNGSYWSLTSIQIDNIVSNPIIVNARFSNLLGRIYWNCPRRRKW